MRRGAGGEGKCGWVVKRVWPHPHPSLSQGQGGARGTNTPHTHHPCITTEAECVRVFNNRGGLGTHLYKDESGSCESNKLGEGRPLRRTRNPWFCYQQGGKSGSWVKSMSFEGGPPNLLLPSPNSHPSQLSSNGPHKADCPQVHRWQVSVHPAYLPVCV